MGLGVRAASLQISFLDLLGPSELQVLWFCGFRLEDLGLGFRVHSRSLIEGLYSLWKPYRNPIYTKLPTCRFLQLSLFFRTTSQRGP